MQEIELLAVEDVRVRLNQIFPPGTPRRTFLIREIAAKVVFTMLYIGAVEGEDTWLGPKHVYYMSDSQAGKLDQQSRKNFADQAWKPKYKPIGERWYADTTRESIRDETLREGLVDVGAVIQKSNLPTTSSYPRYALRRDFASLFSPALQDEELDQAIAKWSSTHLSALALARMAVIRRGATAVQSDVVVTLPNRSVRQLAQGPSSVLIKAVVEEFLPRFLYAPAVILLSESRNKIVVQEQSLLDAIGLRVEADRLLPDLIVFDTEPGRELLVFVEVVATDGPVTDSRKAALLAMAAQAHIPPSQLAFVTVYQDRDHATFRKTFGSLAWNTLVWLASEPDYIILLRDNVLTAETRIFDLLPKG
jgi:hypothetical protein